MLNRSTCNKVNKKSYLLNLNTDRVYEVKVGDTYC